MLEASILRPDDVSNSQIVDEARSFIEKVSSVCGDKLDAVSKLEAEVSKLEKSLPTAEPKEVSEKEGSKKVHTIRYFVASLSVSEQSYPCEHCPMKKPFNNFKSLQRHQRKCHSGMEKVSAQNIPEKNKITCMMTNGNGHICGNKVQRNDITRHLKLCHEATRPNHKEFKGFFSFDSKKNWTVAWGARGEIFESEVEVEVEAINEIGAENVSNNDTGVVSQQAEGQFEEGSTTSATAKTVQVEVN